MFCPDGVVDIPEACGAISAESLQPGFESRSGRLFTGNKSPPESDLSKENISLSLVCTTNSDVGLSGGLTRVSAFL